MQATPAKLHAETQVFCDFYGFIKGSPLKTASVKADAPAKNYFRKDGPGCPGASDKKCLSKAYLISGDSVVVSRTAGSDPAWACVWYRSAKGKETIGWFPRSALAVSDPVPRPASQWIGAWKDGAGQIRFQKGKDENALFVDGSAVLKIEISGGERTGDLYGPASLRGAHVSLTSRDRDDPQPCQGDFCCRAEMDLIGDFLFVSDNNQCGGMSVSFNGIYRKP